MLFKADRFSFVIAMRLLTSYLTTLFCLAQLTYGEPTESRTWTSAAGTTLDAIAQKVDDGKVFFQKTDGSSLTVPLDKLSEADQAVLVEHFELVVPQAGIPFGSGLPQASDLPFPLGEVSGPITSEGETTYFVYLPTTLKAGRNAPLLYWTGFSPTRKAITARMKMAAEMTGSIAVSCGNSSNKVGFAGNHEFTKTNLKHIKKTLPVDEDRVFFTGVSGGGATAFYNAARLPHAGVLSSVAYIPTGDKPKGGHYFITGGAIDYNRYGSALAAEKLGTDVSTIRYTLGGHHEPIEDELVAEGLLWMNLRYYAENVEELIEEQKDLEVQVLEAVTKLKERLPHRAYHWALMTSEILSVSEHNQTLFDEFLAELGTDANKRYAEGIADLEKFGLEYFAPLASGSAMDHTTPEIQEEAEKLATEFEGVPEIPEIARYMKKPTNPK